MSIWTKILAVQVAAKTIKKEGYNSFHKYNYATEADVLAVKELMNQHGLIAFPSLVENDVTMRTTKDDVSLVVFSRIKYTVVDTETGESVESIVLGCGEDKGDKGAYKAATGASKYFYLKFFGVATGDDPEQEEEASKKQTKQTKQSLNDGLSAKDLQTLKLNWTDRITGILKYLNITKEQAETIIGNKISSKEGIDYMEMIEQNLKDFANRFQNNQLTIEERQILGIILK